MKTGKDNDQLRDLFCQLPLVEVSPEFETNLMLHIHQEAVAQSRKKKIWSKVYTYVAMTFGVLVLISIPFIVNVFADFDFKGIKFNLYISGFQQIFTKSLRSVEIPPIVFIVSFSALFLLIIDLFLRKSIYRKHNYV